jgi:hypothetical protein
LNGEDYRAHYSTLFAVKRPFGQFELDPRALPIATLLEEFSKTLAKTEQGQNIEVSSQNVLTNGEDKLAPFIYLPDNGKLERKNINIFD